MEPLEIDGDPPHLDGLRCDAILCQEYWHGGILVEAANVVHLGFDDRWYRLYFDLGIVFWRPDEGRPVSFQAPEIDSEYYVIDLAETRGLRGIKLLGYRMTSLTGADAEVSFEFENGARLTFQSINDVTTYRYA